MARPLAFFACLVMLLASCSRTGAPADAPGPPAHSRASLIVENSSLLPGSKANLGIQFIIDDGWHIYWQNPGDSGEPPKIQWRLPAGITTGTLEWPVPTRLKTTAGTDYGYVGPTVLLLPVQIPPTVQPGSIIELDGDLRWLVCREVCVPQRTQLKVPLRIATTNTLDSKAHLLLQAAFERIPKPVPAPFHPIVTSSADGFRLSLVNVAGVTQAEFFPAEEEQIDNGATQNVSTLRGILQLDLKKSENLKHDPEHLTGIVVINRRDAYQIDVPVNRFARQKGK